MLGLVAEDEALDDPPAAGDFERVVGRNPDVKVVGGLIHLVGTGPFRGKTFKTALRAADFF